MLARSTVVLIVSSLASGCLADMVIRDQRQRANKQRYEQVMRERREKEAAEAEQVAARNRCRTPWGHRRPHSLDAARVARPNTRPISPDSGVPTTPDRRLAEFRKFEAKVAELEGKGCEIRDRDEFERELRFLEKREQERLAAVAVLAQQKRERDAERAAYEDATRQQARAAGFTGVVFGKSLTDVLDEVVANAVPAREVAKVAIELGYKDKGFMATQILQPGTALFFSDYTHAKILLNIPGASIYEGTSLASLDLDVVRVAGVTQYTSVAGARVQAFRIEPAW